ncbi:MAG: apolipoprotein N-acyltransferase [Bauldia sp.]|nr:apolipoprotein N-acyltransferase [Bauldia sp.]
METLANAVIVLWGWRRFAVAFVAGAISALAFAPYFAFPVLWLTVPVFVWLIDGAEAGEGAQWYRRLLPAAFVGFAFGFGFFVAGLWWIGAALLVDADQFAWALPLAVVALPALLALFWAFGAALARAFWLEGWPRILVFAAAMATAEWLRGHLFTGFPWNAFGYALTPAPLMMQSASLVGVWGLTLAAFFVFAAPALLSGDGRRAGASARIAIAAAAALFLVHLGYGWIRLAHGADPVVPGVALRIIQPAIPQDSRWQIDSADEAMTRYLDLSRGAKGLDGVTHLIWPESAFPFLLTERPSALSAIAGLLPDGTTLITGAARAERLPGGDPLVFNSVYVIDAAGEITAAYDKVHLVPFGEYLPFRGLLDSLGMRQLIALPGGFSPGRRLRTLTLPTAPPFGPLICYEIVFPGAVVEPANRPAWLLNVTNDGWYGRTPGPYQHFLQARVRAVEEGLPLVRAANTGISGIVDAHGREIAGLDLGRIGAVDGPLPAALPPTPYGRFGDFIFLALVVATFLTAVSGKIYRKI